LNNVYFALSKPIRPFMNNKKPKKAGPTKLPSKPLSFSGQPLSKKAGQQKASVSTAKKGGVNHMRKLSGM
jgi:hypothetical protein